MNDSVLRYMPLVVGLFISATSVGCSSSSSNPGPSDGGDTKSDGGGAGDDAGGGSAACRHIGDVCSGQGSCSNGLRCEQTGSNGFCAPDRNEGCGGIAGSSCTGAARNCMNVAGAADYGLCMTDAEKACACAKNAKLFYDDDCKP
ncbi:hypothetical protein [Pendulispora albinea]|uniref:Uncharacterized protein n=1 Tax=Pendulispora albinea TaxID=2741071 RepID=A0ABZ2LWL1_9BACT